MLGFSSDNKHESKVSVTHGTMGHLDPKQPPVKRKPFSTLLGQHFVHKVEFILPKELYEVMKDTLFGTLVNPGYSKVILPLKALLEGEFFNEYIKKGNILMLSEGKFGVDNVYTLREGILSLHLNRESYERAGLVGKPDGVKGKRGMKPRWVVEINLRLPSMLHGKKGFDRIVYAFKNVLTKPVTWLFCNVHEDRPNPDPLHQHFPEGRTCTQTLVDDIKTIIPVLRPNATPDSTLLDSDLQEFAVDVHEWLSLISLGSPRTDPEDKTDPFLCRYSFPGGADQRGTLVKVMWCGFISSSWVHKTFIQALQATPPDAWLAYTVGGFSETWPEECQFCAILKVPDVNGEYVLWEPA